ncbi:MAG: ankyrin repeat domain-containing protein [Bacteroidota bacterium]|nr:ankyrin repeat domain-containing protein [Bacteroidota bacterium]
MKQILFFLFFILISHTLFSQSEEINFKLNMAAYEGDTAKVDILIALGVQVDVSDYDGITALIYAAQNGHIGVAKRLLAEGAQIDHLTWDFRTPLLAAVMAGQFDMAEFLIRSGAQINVKNILGLTSLHYAVGFNNFYMADMLMYYDININAKNWKGQTALDIACTIGYDTIVWMLLDYGSEIDPVDTNYLSTGNTPLIIATQNGHFNVVKLLVESGANIHHLNKKGFNALHVASVYGRDSIAGYLIEKGADINLPVHNELTPVVLAKINHRYSTKKILKKAGAKGLNRPMIENINIKIENSFSSKDYFLGGGLGIHDVFSDISLNLGYQARIGYTPILVKESKGLFYQFYEKRHQIYLGLEKKFVLNPRGKNPKGISLGVKEVFTFGKYRGTVRKVERQLITSPAAGFFIQKDFFTLMLEYQYLDFGQTGLSPHRININFTFDIINVLQPKYTASTVDWL